MLSVDTKITNFSAFTGAFIGAYSHILLDSFMHFDVKPLEPFFGKTFVGIISIDALHSSLVGLFILGLIGFLVKKFKWKDLKKYSGVRFRIKKLIST